MGRSRILVCVLIQIGIGTNSVVDLLRLASEEQLVFRVTNKSWHRDSRYSICVKSKLLQSFEPSKSCLLLK
jgi:hypothetical protein